MRERGVKRWEEGESRNVGNEIGMFLSSGRSLGKSCQKDVDQARTTERYSEEEGAMGTTTIDWQNRKNCRRRGKERGTIVKCVEPGQKSWQMRKERLYFLLAAY